MSSDRFRRCEELFHATLVLPEEERGAFLEQHCGDDPLLRADVERLLAAHARAGDFISSPAIAGAGIGNGPEESWVGRLVGPYRVVREIGRGGMGAVYLAERADGQYQQRVALKVIKRGMDTEQVLARFRAERQINRMRVIGTMLVLDWLARQRLRIDDEASLIQSAVQFDI